jgi:hypothetical protein
MEEYNKSDDSPAFYKMGYNDVDDFTIKEMKRKYMEKYVSDVKRRKMGGSKNIHCPETEINPPTPFL